MLTLVSLPPCPLWRLVICGTQTLIIPLGNPFLLCYNGRKQCYTSMSHAILPTRWPLGVFPRFGVWLLLQVGGGVFSWLRSYWALVLSISEATTLALQQSWWPSPWLYACMYHSFPVPKSREYKTFGKAGQVDYSPSWMRSRSCTTILMECIASLTVFEFQGCSVVHNYVIHTSVNPNYTTTFAMRILVVEFQ